MPIHSHRAARERGPAFALLTLLAFSACTQPKNLRTESSAREHLEDFDAMGDFIARHYCFFPEKAVSWSDVRAHYRTQAASAPSHEAFLRVLEAALDELYDAHTHLRTNLADSWRLPPYDLWADWHEGRAVIAEVRDGSPAARAGVRAGDEILSINGRTIAEATRERLPKILLNPDPAADAWGLLAALAGRHSDVRALELNRHGRPFRVSLPADGPGASTPEAAVTSRPLPSGFGYLRISSFAEDSTVGAFDEALEKLRGTRGLVLDVRDNAGGDTEVAVPIMGRFVKERRPYARMARRQGPELGASWSEDVVPRGPWTYGGPIVVLVNHWSASMAEGFAMGLGGMRRARIVGTRMMGLGAGIANFELPHSKVPVQISAEPVYQLNGASRSTLRPDVEVDLTKVAPDDTDPLLERAVNELETLLRTGPRSPTRAEESAAPPG